jgi:hypothetical protein
VKYPEYDFVFSMFRTKFDDEPQILTRPTEHKDHQWVPVNDILELDLVKDNAECVKMFYEIE